METRCCHVSGTKTSRICLRNLPLDSGAYRLNESCRSNFPYGGRLTETMHFGNIAQHVNRNLTIDPATRSIVGDEEATVLMSGPAAREGWKI